MRRRRSPIRAVLALSLAAARQRLLPLARRAARGERFALTEHGRPVALLAGPDAPLTLPAGGIGAVILAASGTRPAPPAARLAATLDRLDRQLQAAGAGLRVAVVDAPLAEPLAARLRTDLVLVPTANTNRGFASSLKRGVRVLDRRVTAALVVFAARPPVRRATLRTLLRAGAPGDDIGLVLPSYRGRTGHPVLIGRRLFPAVLAVDPRRGLQQLVRKHAARRRTLAVNDPAVLHGPE